jgi:gibberellin 2-oxidase
MVVLSRQVLDEISFGNRAYPNTPSNGIPVINLSDPNAKTLVVDACEEFGFFKVINHGVSMELISKLETEAVKFFSLSQDDKNRAGPPNPFGYGNKTIGPNGDMGWVEYLLFSTNPDLISLKSSSVCPKDPELFRSLVNEYITAVKNMASEILELIADGLNLEPRNVISKLVSDEKSDSFFRLNHYPPKSQELINSDACKNLIGFGAHTDPQIISVVRSNNTSGLQISLRDGTWVSVPPDPFSFFVNVDDCLQVMTNGRFKSVKHRVLAESVISRVSMIYFGGPPPNEKIKALSGLMEEGKESMYKEFTWSEYKNSAYKTRLGDNRLVFFEKYPTS